MFNSGNQFRKIRFGKSQFKKLLFRKSNSGFWVDTHETMADLRFYVEKVQKLYFAVP